MRKRTKAREYALQLLYQVEMRAGEPLEEILASFWEGHGTTDPEVKDFATDLVKGTCAKVRELDPAIFEAAQNWKLARMAVLDRNTLRLATYELLFREDIPPNVTINEAVNMAKKFSQEDSGKFVNGILDKIKQLHKL